MRSSERVDGGWWKEDGRMRRWWKEDEWRWWGERMDGWEKVGWLGSR